MRESRACIVSMNDGLSKSTRLKRGNVGIKSYGIDCWRRLFLSRRGNDENRIYIT